MDDKIKEEVANFVKTSKSKRLFGKLFRSVSKQIGAIFSISIATMIGVILAKGVWTWIQFVWSW